MKRKKFSLFMILFLLIPFLGVEYAANSEEKSKEDKAETKNLDAAEYYQKGRSAYLLFTPKGFQDAIEWYNKAIEADPNFAPAYAGLGEAYSFLGYLKKENFEEYEDFYNKSPENMVKALKLGANTIEVQRALALTYLQLGRRTEAAAAAKRAIELNPNDAESYYVLWAASGRDVESPYIKKALELNPNLIVAHLDLGTTYFFEKGDYAKAVEHYRRALEINPDLPEAHNYLGTTLRTQGHLGQAESEYLKAIELDPNYASAYMNLGITLFYMGKFQESIAQQKKALSLNQKYPDTYYYLARAFEQTNNPKEAVENYQIFINLTSKQEKYEDYTANARERLEKLGVK